MASTIADITAQLKLNNANFKRGINQSNKILRGFSKQVGQMKSMLIAAFSVTAVIGTFKKAIASTQETGDKFAIAMQGASEATTQLLASIATGDFSGLIQNMRNAAEAGKEFAAAMDEVADKSRAIRIQTALAQKEIYKLREIATDTSRQDDERIAAYKQILALTSEQIRKEKQMTEEALDANIQRQITRNDLTKEQGELIKNFVINYDQLTGKELEAVRGIEQLRDELKQLERQKLEAPTGGAGFVPMIGQQQDAAEIADRIREINAELQTQLSQLTDQERQYLGINEALNKLTDEERDAIAQLIMDGAKLERKLQSLQNEAVRGVGSIESKAEDATVATDGLIASLNNLDDSWMSQPFQIKGPQFGKNASNVNGIIISDETAKKAQDNLQAITDGLSVDFPEAAEEAMGVGAQVAYMLTSQFDAMGEAIGKAISGVEGAFKDLAMAIMQNLGNILIMAGVSMGFPAGIPLIAAGAAIQLGGGILKGLGDRGAPASVGSTYSGGSVNFRISGKDLVGVMDKQNYSNYMNT